MSAAIPLPLPSEPHSAITARARDIALDKLASAPPEVRAAALLLLDEISRPLTVRELDDMLKYQGCTVGPRRWVLKAIKQLNIVAVIGP